MEFTALFLATTIVMLVAWRGPRPLAVGPILNIRFRPRPSHYAMSLLAAVAGAVASTRQVLLHIMPGDAGYGSALLGYHYYTWALIGFIAAIVLIAASCGSIASSRTTAPYCRPSAAPSRKPRCGS